METPLSTPFLFMLAVVAAFGYAVATIGMKLASDTVSILAIALLAAGFAAAALTEVELMRTANLSVLYITIIAIETFIVLGYAAVIGEGLSVAQYFGAGLVLVGVTLASH